MSGKRVEMRLSFTVPPEDAEFAIWKPLAALPPRLVRRWAAGRRESAGLEPSSTDRRRIGNYCALTRQASQPGHNRHMTPTLLPRWTPTTTGGHHMTTVRRLALATATACTAALLTSCASLGATASSSDSPAANQPATAAPAATAAATGAQAVNDWWNSTGKTLADKISKTMGDISTDSSSVTAVGKDCQQLVTDVTAAQAGDPIPDKQAQLSWSSALGHLHQGASDCAAGAASNDADQVSKGATEISEGTTDLAAVTSRISELANQ